MSPIYSLYRIHLVQHLHPAPRPVVKQAFPPKHKAEVKGMSHSNSNFSHNSNSNSNMGLVLLLAHQPRARASKRMDKVETLWTGSNLVICLMRG